MLTCKLPVFTFLSLILFERMTLDNSGGESAQVGIGSWSSGRVSQWARTDAGWCTGRFIILRCTVRTTHKCA